LLPLYCLQQRCGLADEALEDALYESQSMRDFVGIHLPRESVPDATTRLKFRRDTSGCQQLGTAVESVQSADAHTSASL